MSSACPKNMTLDLIALTHCLNMRILKTDTVSDEVEPISLRHPVALCGNDHSI